MWSPGAPPNAGGVGVRRLTRSWQLWAALKHPPHGHPLHQRIAARPAPPVTSVWVIGGVAAYYLLLALLLSAAPPAVASGGGAVVTTLVVLPLGVLVFSFSGTAYGVTWTLRVCDALHETRASGVYEVVAVAPPGRAGSAWAVATGALHRGNALHVIPAAELPFTRVGAQAAAAILLVLLVFPGGRAALYVLGAATVGLLFVYMDFVQSGCVALLAGLWAGGRAAPNADARWSALAAFVAVQLATYGLLVVVVGVGFPRLGLPPLGMMGLPQLGVFYLLREPIIGVWWSYLDTTFFPERLVTPDAAPTHASPLA